MDRALLSKATSATDEPTSGYLLDEIAQMTHSAPDACHQMEDYLLNRLKRDDPNVKLKTLKVIRYVVEHGKSDFYRSIRRKCDRIRSCQSYSAPPHAVLGDGQSKLVREEAAKCLKALFAETPAAPDVSRRIEGFGSHSSPPDMPPRDNTSMWSQQRHGGPMNQASSQRYSTAVPPDRMIGFGSPEDESGYGSSKSEQALKYISDTASKYIPVVKQQIERGLHMLKLDGGASSTRNSSPPRDSAGYSSPDRSYTNSYGGNNLKSHGSMSDAPNYPSTNDIAETKLTGTYEYKVVSDLLIPGGAKISPPGNLLNEFLKKCCTLDVEMICRALFTQYTYRLSTHHNKLRILLIVEALISSKELLELGKVDTLRDFIKKHYLVVLYHDKAIFNYRNKITDILVLLGLEASRPKSVESRNIEAGLGSATSQAASKAAEPLNKAQNVEKSRNFLDDDLLNVSNTSSNPQASKSDPGNGSSLWDDPFLSLLSSPSTSQQTIQEKGGARTSQGQGLLGELDFLTSPPASSHAPRSTHDSSFFENDRARFEKPESNVFQDFTANWNTPQRNLTPNQGDTSSQNLSELGLMGDIFNSTTNSNGLGGINSQFPASHVNMQDSAVFKGFTTPGQFYNTQLPYTVSTQYNALLGSLNKYDASDQSRSLQSTLPKVNGESFNLKSDNFCFSQSTSSHLSIGNSGNVMDFKYLGFTSKSSLEEAKKAKLNKGAFDFVNQEFGGAS